MRKSTRQVLSFLREILFRNNKHTIQYGLAKGLKRIGGISFLPLSREESRESKFLETLNLHNKIVYDIGAYEGIMTLFFARKVEGGKVIAFEPNPKNFDIIKRNIDTNAFDNVLISNFAIGEKNETIDLEVPKYFGGRGSLIQNKLQKNKDTYKVKVTNIDYLINQKIFPIPDFIKIDVEGYELEALKGMQLLLGNKKPQLFIEVHEFIENNMNNIVEFLKGYNYNIYHVENDICLKGKGIIFNNYGHLFCEIH